jgi:uncharacterized repeat protein (TIGR03803 family)
MRWLAMQRTQFPSFVRQSLTTLALTATLIASAWAQPKFKILSTVPGGLFSGLTFDAKGSLYGVTGAGGDDNQGTIFELTPGAHGWTLNSLHRFDGQNGGSPNGGLIFDATGNFYGTALGGRGLEDGGVAYEMVRRSGGWDFTVLYYFCVQYHCPAGGGPGPLMIDSAGNLFGLAGGGGTYDEGVVFELAAGVSESDWNEQVLYDFQGTKTGFGPSGPLVFDGADNLYGTTYRGGRTSSFCYFGCGTVFRLRRASAGRWTESVLFSFDGSDGLSPYSGVLFDSSGNLYGTTNQGGNSSCGETTCGVVFRLTKGSDGRWKETMLYDFPDPANGSNPTSGVMFDKTGSLYGTAGGGNSSCSGGCGVVYRLSPTATGKWKYAVLHKFTGQDGYYPGGGVVLDGKGNLYGTAYSVVFEITP